MARLVPLSFTVVCIESIPAYVGVVVRGYYSWCMSGSLAGQLRFSRILGLFENEGVEGFISVAVYSNELARCPFGGQATVHAGVLPSGRAFSPGPG
jgi:hypothetical protein